MACDRDVGVDSYGVYEIEVADFEWRRPAEEEDGTSPDGLPSADGNPGKDRH